VLTRLKGERERAILALRVGCGLHRREAGALAVEDVQPRDGHRDDHRPAW